MGLLSSIQQISPLMQQTPQFGGIMGAFSQNPQFQQQLQGLMGQQSPGFGPTGRIMPPSQISPMSPIGNSNTTQGISPFARNMWRAF